MKLRNIINEAKVATMPGAMARDKDVKTFMNIWKKSLDGIGNTPDWTDEYHGKVKRVKDNRDSRLNKDFGVYSYKGSKFDVTNDTDAKVGAFERGYFITKI